MLLLCLVWSGFQVFYVVVLLYYDALYVCMDDIKDIYYPPGETITVKGEEE